MSVERHELRGSEDELRFRAEDVAGGVPLGHYTTPDGERELQAITVGDALYVIDVGPGDAVLVEPDVEGMAEAEAIAVEYCGVAENYGQPQSRHRWPPEMAAPDGEASACADREAGR